MSTSLALFLIFAADPVAAPKLIDTGNLAWREGRLPDAEIAFREAVRVLDTIPCGSEADLAVALNNLGTLLAARHQFERALPVLRRAFAMSETTLPPQDRAQIAANAAQVYIRLGNTASAEPLIDFAHQINDATSSPYLPYTFLIRAELRIVRRDWARAQGDLDQAFLFLTAGSSLLAGAHHLRGVAWRGLGNHKAAVREFAAAVELARALPDWKTSLDSLGFLDDYQESLRKTGDRRGAQAIKRERQDLKIFHPAP